MCGGQSLLPKSYQAKDHELLFKGIICKSWGPRILALFGRAINCSFGVVLLLLSIKLLLSGF